jgi:cytochrome c6
VLLRVLLKMAALAGAAAYAGAALAQPSGATLFEQNCAACHQAKGEGIAGAFPALAGSKIVLGDAKESAWIVTHGRGGMPNFAEDLSDAQIAAVLNFVRSSWGNAAPPMDAALVASVRGQPAPPSTQQGLPFH